MRVSTLAVYGQPESALAGRDDGLRAEPPSDQPEHNAGCAVLGLIVATYLISLVALLHVDRPLSRMRERWVEPYLLRAPGHAVVQK